MKTEETAKLALHCMILQTTYLLQYVSGYYEDTDYTSQDTDDYDIGSRSTSYHHHSIHHHKRSQELLQPGGDHYSYRSRGRKRLRNRYHSHNRDDAYESDDSHRVGDDCNCSCEKCETPSDCCSSLCNTCPGIVQAQSSLVFVPYPYPLVVPSGDSFMKSSSSMPTTEAKEVNVTIGPTGPPTTITTSTEPAYVTGPDEALRMLVIPNKKYLRQPLRTYRDENMMETEMGDNLGNIIVKTPEKTQNGNNKYILTSLRKTKPTWTPKFGIVPIPDNMAEKLMSQLRDNARRLGRRQNFDIHK